MNNSTNASDVDTFCRFTPYCSLEAVAKCREMRLRECSYCNVGTAYVIIVFLTIFGLLTVIGNLLVFFVFLGSNKGDRTKKDYIRVSLAAADIVKGVDILVVSIPHAVLSLNETVEDIIGYVEYSKNTRIATAGGVFVIYFYTSSLFHLLYFSGQRFIAVRFPFKYRNLSTSTTVWHLGLIWAFSLVTSSIPAWFDGDIDFSYDAGIFQFFVTLQNNRIGIKELVPMSVLLLFPYLSMTILTIITTVFARTRLRRSNRLRGVPKCKKRERKENLILLKLSQMMVIGYTVTVVPIIVILFLEFFNVIPCSRMSTVTFIVFYLSVSTGLGDVITYSVHDPSFRDQVRSYARKVFKQAKTPLSGGTGASSPAEQNQQVATVT